MTHLIDAAILLNGIDDVIQRFMMVMVLMVLMVVMVLMVSSSNNDQRSPHPRGSGIWKETLCCLAILWRTEV